MPNAQLAQRILDEITAQPNHFEMSSWFNVGVEDEDWQSLPASAPITCGTTMCIAGWACHLEGYDLRSDADGVHAMKPEGGIQLSIQAVAQDLLDIPGPALFHADSATAIEALRQIADGGELDLSAAGRAAWGDPTAATEAGELAAEAEATAN